MMSPPADRQETQELDMPHRMLLLRCTRKICVSYREPRWRAILPLMGVRFFRGATFPKRDLLDYSLDWTQPYERTTPTQTDRSLSS